MTKQSEREALLMEIRNRNPWPRTNHAKIQLAAKYAKLGITIADIVTLYPDISLSVDDCSARSLAPKFKGQSQLRKLRRNDERLEHRTHGSEIANTLNHGGFSKACKLLRQANRGHSFGSAQVKRTLHKQVT